MNSPWFPDRKLPQAKRFMFDSVQEEPALQAGLFDGFDVNYTQLSTGKFQGRVSSAHLGQISIYVEYTNRSIEKQIKVSPNEFAFFLLLDGKDPTYSYGVSKPEDWVHVVPPNGETILVCPENTVVLMFAVNRNALIYNEGLMAEASHWLINLEERGEYLKSKDLHERLRTNILSARDSAGQAKTPRARATINQATIFTIAYALTMEWLKQDSFTVHQRTAAFERYQQARKLLLEELLLDELRSTEKNESGALAELGSRRSIELAFAKHVFMGPLAYHRVVRLHSVRRKLMEKGRQDQNIGDIASEEGFWDWSKFSIYYRKQFGELPSQTRKRLRR